MIEAAVLADDHNHMLDGSAGVAVGIAASIVVAFLSKSGDRCCHRHLQHKKTSKGFSHEWEGARLPCTEQQTHVATPGGIWRETARTLFTRMYWVTPAR